MKTSPIGGDAHFDAAEKWGSGAESTNSRIGSEKGIHISSPYFIQMISFVLFTSFSYLNLFAQSLWRVAAVLSHVIHKLD